MLALLLSIALSPAHAGALNPWGSATSPAAALINPYVYVTPDAVNPILYGSAGLAEGVDLYMGYGQVVPQLVPGVGTVELFPRFFVVPQLALVPHLYWTPGVDGVIPAAEVHLNLNTDRFAFVANAGWRPLVDRDGFHEGTVPLLLAPELKLTGRFSAYVEVDPTLSLQGDDPALVLVPGFGATLDRDGRHAVSAGLQIPILPDLGVATLGAWYCFTIPAEA